MHRSAGRCSPEVRIWEAWRSSADHSRETPFHENGQTDRSLPLPRRHPGEVAARRHSWISGAPWRNLAKLANSPCGAPPKLITLGRSGSVPPASMDAEEPTAVYRVI